MSRTVLSHKIAGGIVGAMLALTSLPLFAQAYPARPIEVIVHTSAGSGGDVVSRAMAEIVRREKFLPQPLMVVNRVGGSGAYTWAPLRHGRGPSYGYAQRE